MANPTDLVASGYLHTEVTGLPEPQPVFVALDSFVLRQTEDSKYSHFVGEWDTLLELAAKNIIEASMIDGKDILEIPVCPHDVEGTRLFYSGVVDLTTAPHTYLKVEFAARRSTEAPYIQVSSLGRAKVPATEVRLIAYSRERLRKDEPDMELPELGDYFVVSINASTREGGEPQTPMAMARNYLGLEGGTRREYTADEFAQAILFWSTHVMCG